MSVRTRSDLGRLLRWPLLRRVVGGAQVAGPEIEDGLRVAAELIAVGSPVALEHRPDGDDDVAAELTDVVRRVHAAGFAPSCELALPVDRLGPTGARSVAEAAHAAGLPVVLVGSGSAVEPLAALLPHARIALQAGETDAEARCRALSSARVRLVAGHGAAADLSFVRCLNVLMAGTGHLSVAVTDPRLIAITGERAAWNGRTPDSWEYVMPFHVRIEQQQRLVAAGYPVRVAVVSGPGALGRHA